MSTDIGYLLLRTEQALRQSAQNDKVYKSKMARKAQSEPWIRKIPAIESMARNGHFSI
jgi:hypothetical protein